MSIEEDTDLSGLDVRLVAAVRSGLAGFFFLSLALPELTLAVSTFFDLNSPILNLFRFCSFGDGGIIGDDLL